MAYVSHDANDAHAPEDLEILKRHEGEGQNRLRSRCVQAAECFNR